jgi:hypothetical protein
MHLCIHLYMRACMHPYIHGWCIHVCIHSCIHRCMHSYYCGDMRVSICTCMYASSMYGHIPTWIHSPMYTSIPAFMPADTHYRYIIHMYLCTFIYTYLPRHMHTCIHAYLPYHIIGRCSIPCTYMWNIRELVNWICQLCTYENVTCYWADCEIEYDTSCLCARMVASWQILYPGG